MRKIVFDPSAFKEYESLIYMKPIIKRVNKLIDEISKNGYNVQIGKPEPLKGNYHGYWSVRSTHGDRIIFKVTEDAVYIASFLGHYYDN